MTLVVDASVAFKWFAQEDGTDRALAFLERGEPIVAPGLILAEYATPRGSRCAGAS
jgi:predicted nucleic acid-binding protein